MSRITRQRFFHEDPDPGHHEQDWSIKIKCSRKQFRVNLDPFTKMDRCSETESLVALPHLPNLRKTFWLIVNIGNDKITFDLKRRMSCTNRGWHKFCLRCLAFRRRRKPMSDQMNDESFERERREERILHWLIECPETEDVADADISALTSSNPRRLMIKNCSFWPERKDCQQECLRKI